MQPPCCRGLSWSRLDPAPYVADWTARTVCVATADPPFSFWFLLRGLEFCTDLPVGHCEDWESGGVGRTLPNPRWTWEAQRPGGPPPPPDTAAPSPQDPILSNHSPRGRSAPSLPEQQPHLVVSLVPPRKPRAKRPVGTRAPVCFDGSHGHVCAEIFLLSGPLAHVCRSPWAEPVGGARGRGSGLPSLGAQW